MIGPKRRQVAECVGLWLAEGDNKSKAEITFTNNSLRLIRYFHKIIRKLLDTDNFRLYAYYPSKVHRLRLGFKVKTIKFYIDRRANKPYFIIRLASRRLVQEWKEIVQLMENERTLYRHILRGFFAGEGNIKTGSHSNRTLRIAQKSRTPLIDDILKDLGVSFSFSQRERAYIITGRSNWEKLAKIKVSDLNPLKKEKFWEVYNSFKEWHYPKHYIRNNLISHMNIPKTSSQLSL